jgi:hypothetical protein
VGETRVIPRPKVLNRYLGAQPALPGTGASNNSIRRRALRDWTAANEERAKQKLPALEPLDLHECRHSYAVWVDAAGISNSRADRYTGHSNRTMGEHYRGHPLTAAQLQADAAALDAYLETQSAEVVELPKRGRRFEKNA